MQNLARFVRAAMLLAALPGAVVFSAPRSLDGVWQSLGYGDVYEIHGSNLRAREVTTQTCVAGFTAKRVSGVTAEHEATFKTHGDRFFIDAGVDNDHKLLIHADGLAKIRIQRLAKLPVICKAYTPDTPTGNFEVFIRTFQEQYISFDRRRVDWDNLVAANRDKVTPETTPAQLFDVLDSMLKQLGDLHTGIEASKIKRESPTFFRPGSDRIIRGGVDRFATKGRRKLFAITDRECLPGLRRKFCNDQIEYAHATDGIGYLRILSFGGYSKHGDNARALDSALDEIFSDRGLRALVIDVRLAFGGDDRLGLMMASRLADREYLAYSIQARADPVEREKWTPADPVFVQPSSRPGFRGPVAELIGPITMSAAETFTQALMGRSPHVTRIGENTQGVFCDVLDRHLPNGWTFSLPNAVYRTTEGRAFDVEGIPPDISVPVFADEDVKAGRDLGLKRALQILNSHGAN